MTKNLTANELFWLAEHAHHTLYPPFAELKVLEPSIHVTIEMAFADEASVYPSLGGVEVSVHWAREGMFLKSGHLKTFEDIDQLAAEVRADIEKLKSEALVTA